MGYIPFPVIIHHDIPIYTDVLNILHIILYPKPDILSHIYCDILSGIRYLTYILTFYLTYIFWLYLIHIPSYSDIVFGILSEYTKCGIISSQPDMECLPEDNSYQEDADAGHGGHELVIWGLGKPVVAWRKDRSGL